MAALSTTALLERLRGQPPRALVAVCSAHPVVLDAALSQALEDGAPLLVEATSNQVNPEGGYTGQTPGAFAAFVRSRAGAAGLSAERVVLGGDHLGPHPYRALPAARAMASACALVRDCVAAGYRKLHLDASMRLGGDPASGPSPELVTQRTVELCAAAEQARALLPPGRPAPLYVIGTDVPTPGGETTETAPPAVTPAGEAERAVALAREAFAARGLDAAWQRVLAVVVQPGIDFTPTRVFDYDAAAAAALADLARRTPGLVFEAHSTDYQRPQSLCRLVGDGFGVLKVGPWLTFAFRQAVLGLEAVECEWLGGRRPLALSGLRDALEAALEADPRHWAAHHRRDDVALRAVRAFGFSDRVRYYWPAPLVQAALARLVANLRAYPPPLPLLSQYLPAQYAAVRAGEIGTDPDDLVRHAVRDVLRVYAFAAGGVAVTEAGEQCG